MLPIKFSQPRSTSRDAFPVSEMTDIERMGMPSGLTVSPFRLTSYFIPIIYLKFPVLAETARYPSARRSQTI